MMCCKCCKCTGWMFLVLGVLFLLRDLGIWDFWNIGGWTVLFVVVGLLVLGKTCCKDCQACCPSTGKKKK